MLSKVNSMALLGLDGYLIEVQVDVSNGMPCWEMVGLPDASVKEAKERVKTAIKSDGFIGIFTGGISATAGGVAAAIFFGYIISVIFNPKTKP